MRFFYILTLALFLSAETWGSASNFTQVKLPLGLTLKVPSNWWVLGKELNKTIDTSVEAIVDLSGLEMPQEKDVVLLRANSMPRSTYANVSVSAGDAEFEEGDLRSLSRDHLADMEPIMKKLLADLLIQSGWKIEKFEPIKIVELDGFYGLQMNYQRSGPKGSVIVTQTRYVMNDKEINITLSYRKKESGIWKPIITYISKSVSFEQSPLRETNFKLTDLKNIHISKDFGFRAAFPSEIDELSLNHSSDPIRAFAALDVSEEDERIIMYQIITSKINKTEQSSIENEDDAYKVIQATLDLMRKEGGEYDNFYEKSRIDSQPMIKFTCKQSNFFREGITSYKHGFAVLNKDIFYRVMVHSMRNNQELEEAARRFFASFSFIDVHEETTKKNVGDKNNRPWRDANRKAQPETAPKNLYDYLRKDEKINDLEELQKWLDNNKR